MSMILSFITLYSLFLYSLGNFKAVYQRARAHAALCNEDEARRDFEMVEKLDPKFRPFVHQELKKLGERIRVMHVRQNKSYWDMTQEKWGPAGSKTKFAQKPTEETAEADKNTDESKTEERESSEKPVPAETKGVDNAETEKSPDVKAEQSNKELENGRESEEGLDNENTDSVVVQEYGQGEPDNQATDKDSNPAPTNTGKDNVVSRRSATDKGRKKVRCQSSAALGPSRTSQGNKATRDKKGNCGTKSE